MLSGSRALEFLGGQGIPALGILVLFLQDSLLLVVQSTVPAEEVARLQYADLPCLLVFSLLLARLCPEQDASGFDRHSCSLDLASTEDSMEVFGGAGHGWVLFRFLC